MRKIKVGAIQPKVLDIPSSCQVFSADYDNRIAHIMESHIKPQLDVTLRLLEQAGLAGLGIVTTSEDICVASYYMIDATEQNIFPGIVKASAAYAEEKLCQIARKHHMYIIGCYFKAYDEGIYNVASLFDRTGQITGEYRKTHLPPNEMWQVAEGNALEPLQTDFGRIGLLTCYDMMFPEAARVLALKGAEIVFHPTAGYGWYDAIGEATLRTRANDNSFYIVTAKNYCYNGAGKSSVIDYWGQVLADAGFYADVLVQHEIDLDIPKTQPDWFYQTKMSGIAHMPTRYAMERRPDLYGITADQTLYSRLTAPDEPRKKELMEMVRNNQCRWS